MEQNTFKASPSKSMSEQEKQSIFERLWLTYYNDTLYEKGVISEREHRKMKSIIRNRGTRWER